MKNENAHTSRQHQNAREQNQREGKMGSPATFTSYAELFSSLQERVRSLMTLSGSANVPEPVTTRTSEWLAGLETTLTDTPSLDESGEVGKQWLQSGPGPQIEKLDEALEALEGADASTSTLWTLRAHIALAETLESIARSIPRTGNSDWLEQLAEQAKAIATEVTRVENELEVE